jgi:hypothetical protein
MSTDRDHRDQAPAILAAGTLALGFGAFGVAFQGDVEPEKFSLLRTFLVLISAGTYLALVKSVYRLFRQDKNVSSSQVADGPVRLLFGQVGVMAVAVAVGFAGDAVGGPWETPEPSGCPPVGGAGSLTPL